MTQNLLRIGASGHRALVDEEKLQIGVQQAFDFIHTAFPARRWRIYSQLAEGADRFITQEAWRFVSRQPGLSVELAVVLPQPVAQYRLDFPNQGSVSDFDAYIKRAARVRVLPQTASRETGYRRAGVYIIERSQVYIVLWDGLPEQGAAGTGEMMRIVRQRGLPLAWISAGNRQPGSLLPTSLGRHQGLLSLERFPTSSST